MKTWIVALLIAMAISVTASSAEAKVIEKLHNPATGEEKIAYQVEDGDNPWNLCREFISGQTTLEKVKQEIMLPNGISDPRKLATGTVLIVIVKKAHLLPEATVSKEMEAGKAESEKKIADLERENAELKKEAVRLQKIISDLETARRVSDQEHKATEVKNLKQQKQELLRKEEPISYDIRLPIAHHNSSRNGIMMIASALLMLVIGTFLAWEYIKNRKHSGSDKSLDCYNEKEEEPLTFATMPNVRPIRPVSFSEEEDNLILIPDGINRTKMDPNLDLFIANIGKGDDYEKRD